MKVRPSRGRWGRLSVSASYGMWWVGCAAGASIAAKRVMDSCEREASYG
jgi:hypothetical protein